MRTNRNLARLLCCSWFALAVGCGGDSIDRLSKLLNDPDANVRRSAATELAGIRGTSSHLIAALALASRNDDVEVREIAVDGLGKKAVDNHEAVSPLEQALADEDHSVRLKAALAIYRIDPQDVRYRPALSRVRLRIRDLADQPGERAHSRGEHGRGLGASSRPAGRGTLSSVRRPD